MFHMGSFDCCCFSALFNTSSNHTEWNKTKIRKGLKSGLHTVKWNHTLGKFQFLFSSSTPHRPQTPGPVKTSNAGRDESVCGTSGRDGDAAWYARTPVPRVVRATASAPATTPLTRASAPWGRPPALWVSSWKSNTRAPATVSRGC